MRVRVRVKLVVKVGDVNDVASPVVVTEDMLELNDEWKAERRVVKKSSSSSVAWGEQKETTTQEKSYAPSVVNLHKNSFFFRVRVCGISVM